MFNFPPSDDLLHIFISYTVGNTLMELVYVVLKFPFTVYYDCVFAVNVPKGNTQLN